MNSQGTACLTDNVQLTQWQATLQQRTQQNVQCQPQSIDGSLKSSGNYYSYRDGREQIDLDGSTGTYRRVYYGTLSSTGASAFTREIGCFWYKVDATYGPMVYFDSTHGASTEYVVPTEIYYLNQTGSNWLLTRNDDVTGWDYTFCPTQKTPTGFCDELRNGNYMYQPNVSSTDQTALLNEAKAIRTQFSYAATTHAAFNAMWNSLGSNGMTESMAVNWVYQVKSIVDTPSYIDPAWRGFMTGSVASMPDVSSPENMPVCFSGKQSVTTQQGGQAAVYGQICWDGATYSFIQ
jgi:hypothetical protein